MNEPITEAVHKNKKQALRRSAEALAVVHDLEQFKSMTVEDAVFALREVVLGLVEKAPPLEGTGNAAFTR